MADIGAAQSVSGEEVSSEETLLLEHVRRIEQSRKDFFAVHVHLSRLRPQYRAPHYLRIAARAFNSLTSNYETTLYVLSNSDMVLVCRDVPVDELDEPIYKLRSLFSEDPITYGQEGSLDDQFTSWYDLSQSSDYATFTSVAEALAEAAAKQRERRSGGAAGRPRAMTGAPLAPANLSAIESRLQAVPMADLIRQQTAVVVHPAATGEVLFHEHYLSMVELQERIAPQVDLFANAWLFQYLTETVDRRVLSVITQSDFSEIKEAISLNLNVTTVLSPGFQNFHGQVGTFSDKVVIEMQVIDIFSDMDAYVYARDWLQTNGYRVLIDGLNPLALQFFDPSFLEADFVKIIWSSDLVGGVPENRVVEMHEVLEHVGRRSVILSRVDSEEAVKWGLTLGVQRFQGHFIDRIVEKLIDKGII